MILAVKLGAELTEKLILEGKAQKLDFLVFADVEIKKSRFRGSENHEKSMQHGMKNPFKIEVLRTDD